MLRYDTLSDDQLIRFEVLEYDINENKSTKIANWIRASQIEQIKAHVTEMPGEMSDVILKSGNVVTCLGNADKLIEDVCGLR